MAKQLILVDIVGIPEPELVVKIKFSGNDPIAVINMIILLTGELKFMV